MARNKHYLSVAWIERKGKYLAVISEGREKAGDKEVKICSLELFDNKKDAEPWYKQQLETKPWMTRQ